MRKKLLNGIISRYWWIPLVTGLISIVFGIWCLCDPRDSLPFMAGVFAVMICAAGVANFVVALSNKSYPGWGWSLCLGILELICGVWMFCIPAPELTVMFMYIIGIWILVAAINGACEAFTVMAYNPIWVIWMVILLLCTIGFSIVLLTNPIGSLFIEWLYLGIALISFGVYRICFAVNMKRLGKYTHGIL